MGRATGGVIGMKLRKGDEVIAIDVADDTADLLVITENGYGKRRKPHAVTHSWRAGWHEVQRDADVGRRGACTEYCQGDENRVARAPYPQPPPSRPVVVHVIPQTNDDAD